MKKGIIGFIIGLLVMGTIVYAAYKYQANEIEYTPENQEWNVGNVQSAINELYEKSVNAFQNDSWETIIANVKSGRTNQYKVGDVKSIDLGDLGVHAVRIANKSNPSECSTSDFSQTACGFVIEFVDIITKDKRMSEYDVGWPATEMRTYINGTIYNAFPTILKNAIIDTTVVSGYSKGGTGNFTSTDKLYLLSPKEIWNEGTWGGRVFDTAGDKTRQLDYYVNEGITTSNYSGTIKKYDGSINTWWTRTYDNTQVAVYLTVTTSGLIAGGNNYFNYPNNGVSPAFRLG